MRKREGLCVAVVLWEGNGKETGCGECLYTKDEDTMYDYILKN